MARFILIVALFLIVNIAKAQLNTVNSDKNSEQVNKGNDESREMINRYIIDLNSLDNTKKINKTFNKFHTHIWKELEHPDLCDTIDSKCMVVVDFIISEQGKTIQAETVVSLHEEVDEEVKRIISSFDNWPVPLFKGQAVPVKIRYTINFLFEWDMDDVDEEHEEFHPTL